MRSVISILVALLLSITCAASGIYRTQHSAADSCHTGKLSVQVFFKTGSSDIDPDFRGNGKNLSAFSASVANIVSPPHQE
ncbi:MAG: hypothetical protein ACI39U_05075 [Candidatus Cryptobacteroides sp.]